MANIIIPKYDKNKNAQAWDEFFKMSEDAQYADKVMCNSYLEKVKKAYVGTATKAMDGIGECYAMMDSRMYHRQLQNDPDFFKDPSTVKRFFKDNPQYLNDGCKV